MVGFFGEFLGRRIGSDSLVGGVSDLGFGERSEVGTLADGIRGSDVVGVDGEGPEGGPGRCTMAG
jgi:hypothetical protein